MNCLSCGHDNREAAKFCLGCGQSLAGGCASCGAGLPSGARFCDECGHAVAVGSAPEPVGRERGYTPKHLAEKILRSKAALEGERKRVTVLFADVKSSTELAEELDPEEWHAILDRFFQLLAEGVHRFEGNVNQYTGDGIMALFGAPIAHEDHAQRACYAALQLSVDLRGYTQELRREKGLDFAVRMGLNSGEVVVGKIGDDLRMDYTAQGHTVNLASRMEQLAEAGSAYVSEHTAALVADYFDLEDLGPFNVRGMNGQVGVFALRGIGSARTRLDESRARGFSKFVGRDREMQALESALEQSMAGDGQVVGVVAEAGIGKSRLCLEFIENCRARGIRVNEAHCPAHGKTIPYLPLLEMLRDIFDITDRDSDHEARRKIAGELLLLDNRFEELLPLLFDFLGVPDPARPAPDLPPEGRQRQLFGFVRHLAEARSQREPTVYLLDDCHWIDPGSDAFLAESVAAAQGKRGLWLLNFRPEYHADWMSKSYYRQLPLRPLGREAIDELLRDLLGTDASVAGLSDRIYARTSGNPFFVEEVVQSLVEAGSLEGEKGDYRLIGSVDALEIPTRVQSVLAARIDRLSEREKHVLQTASVIDKEFREPILRRVAELPDEDLAAALAELVRAEFIFERALYPEAEYQFKHPLTQEVSYDSQLSDRRARTHAAVARAIEEADADKLDERAALLAHHWEQAGDTANAADWHCRAARWCSNDNPPDALRHWQSARALLKTLPETDETTALRIEAAIQVLNGGWQHGLSEPDADEVFEEGRALAISSNDVRSHVLLVVNRSTIHTLSGTPARAESLVEQARALAEESGDPQLIYWSLDAQMNHQLYCGQLDAGIDSLTRLIGVGAELEFEVDLRGVPKCWWPAYRASFLSYAGRLEEAREDLLLAERPLRELDNAQSLSWFYPCRVIFDTVAGELGAARIDGRTGVEYAEKVGASLSLALAYAMDGSGLVANEEWEAAVSRLELALDVQRRTRGFLTREAETLSHLAEAYLGLGDHERALATAEEAIQSAQTRETRAFEVRAHLALARVLLAAQPDDRGRIQATLDRAQELIEQTGARMFEPTRHELLAALARHEGDAATSELELREAQRLFTDLGAPAQADRIERLLA